MKFIKIQGVRTHNLKNINVEMPRDKLIVITGLSGSGKSSLAFDTLYAEGQRRYVESLSSYARQFLSIMEKPDIDHIEGLSPAISIEQKTVGHNPRSTVGTATEIYDYLRLLMARAGEPRCPDHRQPLQAQTVSQMVDNILSLGENKKIMLLAPLVENKKGEHLTIFSDLRSQGFIRARIDGIVMDVDPVPIIDANKKHTIEVVVDRLKINQKIKQRIAESVETGLNLSNGILKVSYIDETKNEDIILSANFACHHCGYSLSELEPRLFSFNNPAGACQSCDGLGKTQFYDPDRVVNNPSLSLRSGAVRGWDSRNTYYSQLLSSLSLHFKFDLDTPFKELPEDIKKIILYGSGSEKIKFQYKNRRDESVYRHHSFEGVIPNMERRYKETESNIVREELSRYLNSQVCPDCSGTRLRLEARHVFINDTSIQKITAMPIDQALTFFKEMEVIGYKGEIASNITNEIIQRLHFLVNVGLNYLTLDRTANTLSGGETQRIRLASQIGAGLVGVMYILDEPSIGLHQKDNERLLQTLVKLRDIGNTVIVVEHDEDAIKMADHVIDIGPGAGIHGGKIVAQGTPQDIKNNKSSLTGQYLSGEKFILIPPLRTSNDSNNQLQITGASGNNLKCIDVDIPVGLMTCITGVSGSGKSTLINDTIYRYAATTLYDSNLNPAPVTNISGLEKFDKAINIDQSPIGRTPRSNPATYTGLFTPIRELFATTKEARARGYSPGRFSFNVKGGRCEACKGDGAIKVEMHFLPDIFVPCDVCKGKRYNRETLEIKYKGLNINEILALSIEDASEFFSAIPVISKKLDTLMRVGLSYINLGQNAVTLSGGEAQRIKLSRELSKRDTGNTLYILDEPTTGLHFEDIKQLLTVLHELRDHGNTILIIEHNLEVIKTCDWIIDLGPEGGNKGGEIVATGTPEDIAVHPTSYTGQFLRHSLSICQNDQCLQN